MDVTPVSSGTMALASTAQQLQSAMQVQVSLLRELAESQQQVAQMLAASGLGQNVDVRT